MSVGFRKGEGLSVDQTSKNWQNSKLWNCIVCGGEKFRNKCIKCGTKKEAIRDDKKGTNN